MSRSYFTPKMKVKKIKGNYVLHLENRYFLHPNTIFMTYYIPHFYFKLSECKAYSPHVKNKLRKINSNLRFSDHTCKTWFLINFFLWFWGWDMSWTGWDSSSLMLVHLKTCSSCILSKKQRGKQEIIFYINKMGFYFVFSWQFF